jgi:hypothetical protein
MVPPVHDGQRLFGDDLWVAVREWTPDSGGVDQVIQRINDEMPTRPAILYSGHDAKTRDVGSGRTPSYFVSQHWGNIMHIPITGMEIDPRIRHSRVRHAICDSLGHRRMVVSNNLVSCDSNGRGIMDVIKRDAWPDPHKRTSDYWPRDGRLEHTRDAITHFVIKVNPPSTLEHRRVGRRR